jgi:hypothetical protein
MPLRFWRRVQRPASARSGEQGEKRFSGFLDYDTYWDFNADEFGQTLKAGLLFALDEKAPWGLSPSDQFPLNLFTSTTNLKNDVGIELTFRY